MTGSADAYDHPLSSCQGRDNLVDTAILDPRVCSLGPLPDIARRPDGKSVPSSLADQSPRRTAAKTNGLAPTHRYDQCPTKTRVKRQCPGPSPVVAALGKHPDDHPGPACQSRGEKAFSHGNARWVPRQTAAPPVAMRLPIPAGTLPTWPAPRILDSRMESCRRPPARSERFWPSSRTSMRFLSAPAKSMGRKRAASWSPLTRAPPTASLVNFGTTDVFGRHSACMGSLSGVIAWFKKEDWRVTVRSTHGHAT